MSTCVCVIGISFAKTAINVMAEDVCFESPEHHLHSQKGEVKQPVCSGEVRLSWAKRKAMAHSWLGDL